jgi:electron transfer flavoprotein-quinone oxidoreductase
MAEKFDAIVVGAGPAGTSAAYRMAKAGMKVILLERGEYPGAKNVMGGVLYRYPIAELVPEFLDDTPWQRPVVEQNYWILGADNNVKIGYRDLNWGVLPHNNYTVYRAQFDQWYAKKAVEQGVLLINETVVEEAIVEDGRVIGVRTGRSEGDIYADVVIVADGVNSLIAKQLGFRKPFKPSQMAVAAMQVINLPPEKIEDRFMLEKGQGATIEVFGESTHKLLGTGFIYTNKESISIGVGTMMSDLAKHHKKPHDMLESFKAHPIVRKVIEGGEPKEYLAHLLPEGGYHAIPKLAGHGVMIVGDAAQLVNGLHREGSNLAIQSGVLAADAAIRAYELNDYSENILSSYRENLMKSFVGQDLKKYKDTMTVMENNPDYFNVYMPMIGKALNEFFTVNGTSKWDMQKRIMDMVKEQGLMKTGRDVFRLIKAVK